MSNQHIDIANFNQENDDFIKLSGRKSEWARHNFGDVIKVSDSDIKQLEKTKTGLISSENSLRLANVNAEGLTI